MTDPLATPIVALSADKAFDMVKDFVVGRMQARRAEDDAWKQIETSLTSTYSWIGRGEIRKLRARPDVDRELKLARQNGVKPSAAVLVTAFEHVLTGEGIHTEGRPVAEAIDRLIFIWHGSFAVGVVGALADTHFSLRQAIADLGGNQETRNISLADAGPSQDGRPDAEQIIERQLSLAKSYIENGEYQVAWDVLELAKAIPETFGWTDDLRYALLARIGSCQLAFARYSQAKASFEAALKLRPSFPNAIVNLVIARDLCGDPVDESLGLLQPVLNGDQTMPEAVHTKANLLLTKGEPLEAIKLLKRQALLRNDSDIRRDYVLANAYRLAGNLDESADIARRCVAQEPLDPEAHELLGDVLLTQGIRAPVARGLVNTPLTDLAIEKVKLEEAAAEFSIGVAHYSRQGRTLASARCHVNRGLCLLELGEIEAAGEEYRAALAVQPPQDVLLPTLRGLARVALSSGDAVKAREYFQAAADLDEADLPTIYNLALALANINEFNDALTRLESLEEHDLPEDLRVDIQVLKAQMLWHQAADGEGGDAQRKQADEILSRVLSEHPDAWQVYLERAQRMLKRGDTNEALPLLREAVRLAPDNLFVLDFASRFYLSEDLWGDYADSSQRLIERNQAAGRANPPSLYHNCAAALSNTGRFDEALAILDAAAQEPFHSFELSDIRACVLARLNRHHEARECWAALVAAEPDSVRAQKGLGQSEWELYRLGAAYRVLVKAAERDPQDAMLLLNIANTCREMGAAGEAAAWAQKAVAAGADNDPKMLTTALAAASDAGRRDLMSQWFQTLRERYPDELWSEEAGSRHERDQRMAELRAKWEEQVSLAWVAYRCQGLPLARLALELQTPLVEIWSKVVDEDDAGLQIRTHAGTLEDDRDQSVAAVNAEEIAIDLTGLLGLELLGYLHLLGRIFKTVIVPEDFILKIRQDAIRSKGSAARLRLNNVIQFLCEDPVIERVTIPSGVPADLSKVAGDRSTLLAIQAAHERKIPLFVDDTSVQAFLRTTGGEGFGVFGFLKAALLKNNISEQDYARNVRMLIAHGYTAFIFDGAFLADTIRNSAPDGRAANKMLGYVIQLDVDRTTATRVFGEVAWRILSEWPPNDEEYRDQWLVRILEHADHNDPDHFWLQGAIYEIVRLLAAEAPVAGPGSAIRTLYDIILRLGIPPDILAISIEQVVKQSADHDALLQRFIAECPEQFRSSVADAVGSAGAHGSSRMAESEGLGDDSSTVM